MAHKCLPLALCLQLFTASFLAPTQPADYFPPPESKGGWRELEDPQEIRRLGGMDPAKLLELKQWLLDSDDRPFAAVVIRNGYIILEVEGDSSSVTNTKNVASCAKAICATVLAIAAEESQQGRLPRRMTFDDPAFDYIPWAQPLSDPRKAQIKVKQLLNHTSGITPDARYKPGSGGQLISFVPSLDLVITRQTGKSGEWQFEEYVRRAAAAVLPAAQTPASSTTSR